MKESLPRVIRRGAVRLGLAILIAEAAASTGPADTSSNSTTPAVSAPVHRFPNLSDARVVRDLTGLSNAEAYGYGVGLTIGCNPSENLDPKTGYDNPDSFAFAALRKFSGRQPTYVEQLQVSVAADTAWQTVADGLKAGDSGICSGTPPQPHASLGLGSPFTLTPFSIQA